MRLLPPPRIARVRPFGHDDGGATAIEFALVAPLFIGLLFTLFDGGGVIIQSVMIDRALDKAVRVVRVAGSITSHADFRKIVCANSVMIPNCSEKLVVEMTVVTSAASFPTTSAPCIEKNAPAPKPSFSSGSRGDVLYVRACLAVSPMTPWAAEGYSLPRNASGGFYVVAVNGFMNEPGQ